MGLGQPEYPLDVNTYVANEIITNFHQKASDLYRDYSRNPLTSVFSLSGSLDTDPLGSPLYQAGVQTSKSIK